MKKVMMLIMMMMMIMMMIMMIIMITMEMAIMKMVLMTMIMMMIMVKKKKKKKKKKHINDNSDLTIIISKILCKVNSVLLYNTVIIIKLFNIIYRLIFTLFCTQLNYTLLYSICPIVK